MPKIEIEQAKGDEMNYFFSPSNHFFFSFKENKKGLTPNSTNLKSLHYPNSNFCSLGSSLPKSNNTNIVRQIQILCLLFATHQLVLANGSVISPSNLNPISKDVSLTDDYSNSIRLPRSLSTNSPINLKIIELKEEIRKLEEETIKLKSSSLISGDDKQRFSFLENSLRFLKTVIHSVTDSTIHIEQNLEVIVDKAVNLTDGYKAELDYTKGYHNRLIDQCTKGIDTLPECITGLTAIYNKTLPDDPILFLVVEMIWKIHHEDLYQKLNYASVAAFQHLKARISRSIWDFVTAYKTDSRICIQNVQLKEYLYASQLRLDNNEKRRYVFTWAPGTMQYKDQEEKDQYRWNVIKESEGIFRLKNQRYPEYMYAADIKMETDTYQVFTWIPGDEPGGWKAWQFIPTGDNVHIKHVEKDEYLHTGSVRSDGKTRHVLTSKSATKYDHSVWKVESC